MSRNIATKVTDMLADWTRKDADAQTEAVTRLGLPANNTAKDRAKAMGFSDETYYHGSVKDITEFDPSLSNIEGHLGKSIYVTDNPLDASRNYASLQSPDLTVKAENIADRMDDTSIAASGHAAKWIEDFKDNDGIVYPLSIRKGNQLDVSKNSADDIDFNPVYDDAGEEVIEENQNLQNIHDSLYRQANQYDFNFDRASSQLDDFYDYYPAKNLDDNLRGNDALFDAGDESGDLASNEVIRQIYEDMGYDSVKMNANDQFTNLMKGIDDTNHHMIFNPANVRSPLAHFNPKMAGVGAGAVMSGNLMADELDLEYKGQEPSAWDSLMNTISGVNQQQAQAYGDTGANVMGGTASIASMLATDPAVAGEVIGGGALSLAGVAAPWVKGFGAGLLLDSGEASASPKYSDEDFINKLEGR